MKLIEFLKLITQYIIDHYRLVYMDCYPVVPVFYEWNYHMSGNVTWMMFPEDGEEFGTWAMINKVDDEKVADILYKVTLPKK